METLLLIKTRKIHCRFRLYHLSGAACLALYLLMAVVVLKDYFIMDILSLAGTMLLPLLIKWSRPSERSRRYFPLALAFVILSFYTRVLTFYFLATAFGILFLVETILHKTNVLFPLLILTVSPVFRYLTQTFGIPVRLWLSGVSGQILAFTGADIRVSGNIMILNGTEFSVDTACMGLNMLTATVLLGIFYAAMQCRKYRINPPLLKTILFMLVLFLLNVLGNLARIILLVYLEIMPGNPLHEIVGAFCFAAYSGIPLFFISRFIYRPGISQEKDCSKHPVAGKRRYLLRMNLVLLILVIVSGFKFRENKSLGTVVNFVAEGYRKDSPAREVYRFIKPGSLLYIKPLEGFYAAEHNPLVCWSGSGYEIRNVSKRKYRGGEIYTGRLVNGNETIYAAWWFDNGIDRTISQFRWRWDVIRKGKPCFLVNINAASEASLLKQLEELKIRMF